MEITHLLPPITGVRMAWAFTGEFSDDPHSKLSTIMVDVTLKDLKLQAEKNDKENEYIMSAITTINASRRSLDVVYKGRQLNFAENEKLRLAYLEEVREKIEFGEQLKDYLNSLPAITIGAVSGITFSQWISEEIGISPDLAPWLLGLLFAAIGYLVNWWLVDRSRHKTQNLYIRQDYERDIYYEQYINRIADILTSLYLDLDRIHKNVFGQLYPIGNRRVDEVINETLHGVRPTFCRYLHKHISDEKIVTPIQWAICEAGIAGPDTCKYFKDVIP